MKNIDLTLPNDELVELFSQNEWRQQIHLYDDIFTPGTRCEYEWQICHLPESLKGNTFLDVGANDGMFSFLAENKGAEEVTAIDLYTNEQIGGSMTDGWPVNRIETIKKVRNSKVNILVASVYDLSVLNKKFDVTYCGNVLAWLNDPISAINQMAAITKKTLLIREDISEIKGKPVLEYVKSMPSGCVFNGNYEFYRTHLKSLGFRKVSFKKIDEYKIFEKRCEDFLKYRLSKGTAVFKNPFAESGGRLEMDHLSSASTSVNNRLFFTGIGWINAGDVTESHTNLPKQFIRKWIFEKRVRKDLCHHALIIAEK